MAFPSINAQKETNKKILEDLQKKKQLLQKGGVSSTGNVSQFLPTLQNHATQEISSLPINSTVARTAWLAANTQSSGFFIQQESIFGNSLLPVLPRFDQAK